MTFLVTFHTHFDANVFFRKVKALGKAKMKPVPRVLSSSCGTCVEFSPAAADFDVTALTAMEYESIYRIEGESFELLYHID